jgi:hypothetical protein
MQLGVDVLSGGHHKAGPIALTVEGRDCLGHGGDDAVWECALMSILDWNPTAP